MKNLSIDWHQLLWGNENASVSIEVFLRTLLMFVIIIIGLRILGKRGVKQLSVFEMVVLIGLGSAAGDPMMYKDAGIIVALIVFAVVILLYRILTHFVSSNKRFEILLEGKPLCLIENGVFLIQNFKKEKLGSDEFFAELRLKGISHLGQVKLAIVESSGEVSIFCFDNESIKYGLPILPHSLDKPISSISKAGYYSCTFCGYTEQKPPVKESICSNCQRKNWVAANNEKKCS